MTILAQTVDIGQIEELVDVSRVSRWDPLLAVAAVVVGVILGRIVRRAVRRFLRRAELPENLVDLLGTTAMWAIVTLSVLVALSLVGFAVTPLVVAVALVFVLFVVSGREMFENLGAGVTLQVRAPFRPGDQIQTGDTVGRVLEVNSRVVVIDTIDNQRAYVPNSSVLREPILNLTRHRTRMSTLTVELAYGTDLEEARRVLIEALGAAEGVQTDPPPVVEVRSFDPSGIVLAARFWHGPRIFEEWAATDAAARSIDTAIKEHGLTIAFPQRTLWWGVGPDDHNRPGVEDAPQE